MEKWVYERINEKINSSWNMRLKDFEDSLDMEERLAILNFRAEIDKIISKWYIFWIN